MDRVAQEDQRQEAFRVSGRDYSAMYDELVNKDPKVPQSAATQMIVAHIEVLGVVNHRANKGE